MDLEKAFQLSVFGNEVTSDDTITNEDDTIRCIISIDEGATFTYDFFVVEMELIG